METELNQPLKSATASKKENLIHKLVNTKLLGGKSPLKKFCFGFCREQPSNEPRRGDSKVKRSETVRAKRIGLC